MVSNYFAQLGESFLLSTPADAVSVKVFLRQSAKSNPRTAITFEGLQGNDAPTKIIGTGFIDAVQNTLDSITYTKPNEFPLEIPYQAIEIWADNIQSGIALIYYYDIGGRLLDENELAFIRRESDLDMIIEYHRETIGLLQDRLKEVIGTQGITKITSFDGRSEEYDSVMSMQRAVAWHQDRLAVLTAAQSGSYFVGGVVA